MHLVAKPAIAPSFQGLGGYEAESILSKVWPDDHLLVPSSAFLELGGSAQVPLLATCDAVGIGKIIHCLECPRILQSKDPFVSLQHLLLQL